MNDDNAQFFTMIDIFEAALLPLEIDLAGICAVRVDAAQDFHQGRFAGPVFAHQRVNLALLDAEIDVVQCLYTGKRFGDVAHFQYDFSHDFSS